MSRAIAFFDFDGTLTVGDSLLPFLRFVRGRAGYSLDLLAVSPWLAGYMLRLISNERAKAALLRQSFKGCSKMELYQHGRQYSDQHIVNMLNPTMMEKLKEHQRAGHMTVLVSASLDVYLEHWAYENGFDACLCSQLAVSDHGDILGLYGKNCYGAEKVVRIQALLSTLPTIKYSYAYGDTNGDIPMLNFVDEGFWVRKNKLSPVAL